MAITRRQCAAGWLGGWLLGVHMYCTVVDLRHERRSDGGMQEAYWVASQQAFDKSSHPRRTSRWLTSAVDRAGRAGLECCLRNIGHPSGVRSDRHL
nr:hypothetical protein CFP56_19252 [Quercus suber]